MNAYQNRLHYRSLPYLQEGRAGGNTLPKFRVRQGLHPAPAMNKVDLRDLDSVALGLYILLLLLVCASFAIYGIWARLSIFCSP